MRDLNASIRRYTLDVIIITVTAAAAIGCWVYQLPIWMLVICLLVLLFAIISLLGDLGIFGGHSE